MVACLLHVVSHLEAIGVNRVLLKIVVTEITIAFLASIRQGHGMIAVHYVLSYLLSTGVCNGLGVILSLYTLSD